MNENYNVNSPNLFAFLRDHRSHKGETFTNTSLDGGSFNISDEEYDTFLNLYTKNLYNFPKNPLSTTEKKKEDIGILTVDLDFREEIVETLNINTDNNSSETNINNIEIIRKYKLEQIINFCDKIVEYIDKFCINEEDNKIHNYFIFERPEPRIDKNKIKDGAHIIFPYIATTYNFYHYIRNDFIENNLYDIFVDCKYSNSNEDIFDESVIDRNNWMMYGATKKNTLPYKLTYTNSDDIYFKTILSKYESSKKLNYNEIKTLVELFSIRNKNFQTLIKDDKLLEINKKLISSNKNKKNNINFINHELTLQEEKGINDLYAIYSCKLFPNQPISLIENIKKKYSGNNIYFFVRLCHQNPDLKMACPLKGEPHNRSSCPNYLQISKEGLVMKCNDTGDLCNGKTFPNVPFKIPYTISNIIFNNVSIVNNYIEGEPLFDKSIFENDKIQIFKNEDLNSLLLRGLSRTHYDMAKLLYYMFKENFVYSGENWYEYKNHRWIKTKNPSLKNKISEELPDYYEKLKKFYNVNTSEEETKNQNTNIEEDSLKNSEKVKIISSLINKLKDGPYKRNVMEQSQELFINEKFIEALDENRNIICFNNGIYDLVNMEFRNGKLSDYASLCTNCDYVEYEDEDDELYKDLAQFIYRLLPDNEKKNYMLKLIASCLEGHTSDERFHILTGSASNGKSKFTELINESLGDYAFSLPISLLTQKRQNGNNANPEMAKTKGKRFGYLQEPDKGDEINVGYMKEITGGDPISTRKLFGDPFTFKPQFKLVLCCNDLPKIPSSDGGTWRRLRVIEFTSKFVEEPNPERTNEFKKDKMVAEKIRTWRSAFCYMLIKYYKKYKEEGLIEPEEIMKYTQEYEMENNKYQGFYDEYIIKDTKTAIKWSDLLSNYTTWFKLNKEDKMESVKEIKKRFESLFGGLTVKSVRNEDKQMIKGWKGYRLKEIDEDEEENQIDDNL
jgi:P4 family phage/plasmid primase-like protien